MKLRKQYIFLGALLVFSSLLIPNAQAGMTHSEVNKSAPGYGLQPRNNFLSVCFVGDALTSRTTRVQEISHNLRNHFESAANIHFTGFDKIRSTFPACGFPQSGTCNSVPCNYWYPEDIRIALDGTKVGEVPITRIIPETEMECADKGKPNSWGVSPWNVDKTEYRACRYNVFIGNEPDNTSANPIVFWTNHDLHEVGHALGFVHEGDQAEYFNYRGPNGVICANSTSQPAAAANPKDFVPLTHIDTLSVMIYQELGCGINGNFSHTGLSALDRLSLHILYPESERVAEYVGTTVVTTGEKVNLRSSLAIRGARMDKVISSLLWEIDGQESTVATFEALWERPGIKKGTLTYDDFLGRRFATSIEVRVLKPQEFSKMLGGVASAQALLL